MPGTPITSLISLLIIPTAFAAPLYGRQINLGAISSPQPVMIAVPEEVSLYHPIDKLRILKNGEAVAHTASTQKKGEWGGIISNVTLCSVEGGGTPAALHDGDPSTFVRPDPLKNPSECGLSIDFAAPVRVDGFFLIGSEYLKKITISAKSADGTFTTLREVKEAEGARFSSVKTSGLRVTIYYEIAPKMGELGIEGEIPARMLFMAEPGASFTLVYGDEDPPKIPKAPENLYATNGTVFLKVGDEQMLSDDSDGDGLKGAIDNCPLAANPDQKDSDSDGVGDACDNAPLVTNVRQDDRDFDGAGDFQDNCVNVFNPDQRDDDLNGIGYACDDKDGDGVINSEDNCAGTANEDQKDSDGNGAGDACELDRDGDGVPDEDDNCRNAPNDDQNDSDEDEIGDACDSCPSVKNHGQEDRNENGLGDACEAEVQDPDSDGRNNADDNCPALENSDQKDTDNDGRGDACDNCPTIQNQNQKDKNKDGQGDACTDSDGDGFLPHIDNCPDLANPTQGDRDNDGNGDACEDDDYDGILNANDNCKYKSNSDQSDKDKDGAGDKCDDDDDRFSEKYPWVMWVGTIFIVMILVGFVVKMIITIKNDSKAGG